MSLKDYAYCSEFFHPRVSDSHTEWTLNVLEWISQEFPYLTLVFHDYKKTDGTYILIVLAPCMKEFHHLPVTTAVEAFQTPKTHVLFRKSSSWQRALSYNLANIYQVACCPLN